MKLNPIHFGTYKHYPSFTNWHVVVSNKIYTSICQEPLNMYNICLSIYTTLLHIVLEASCHDSLRGCAAGRLMIILARCLHFKDCLLPVLSLQGTYTWGTLGNLSNQAKWGPSIIFLHVCVQHNSRTPTLCIYTRHLYIAIQWCKLTTNLSVR